MEKEMELKRKKWGLGISRGKQESAEIEVCHANPA